MKARIQPNAMRDQCSNVIRIGGRYFEDCNEAELVTSRPSPAIRGVAPYALDQANADRLWDLSERMLATGAP